MNIYSFLARDGLELHGQLHSAENKNCVVHVHGLGGNFYKDWFTPTMVSLYKDHGYDYFTFNNRGSDFVKRMKYPAEDRQRWLGYSYELFEESQFDIVGAIEFLKEKGYENFILQGHSSGCQKILYTLSLHTMPEVSRVVLLSPCDDMGLLLQDVGKEGFEERIKIASRAGEKLITDPDFFSGMPITGATFLSHFGENSFFDSFHYYDENRPFPELSSNTRSTLTIFGSLDYVIDYSTVQRVFAQYKNYNLEIIEGAGHKYDGCEHELRTVISSWVSLKN